MSRIGIAVVQVGRRLSRVQAAMEKHGARQLDYGVGSGLKTSAWNYWLAGFGAAVALIVMYCVPVYLTYTGVLIDYDKLFLDLSLRQVVLVLDFVLGIVALSMWSLAVSFHKKYGI